MSFLAPQLKTPGARYVSIALIFIAIVVIIITGLSNSASTIGPFGRRHEGDNAWHRSKSHGIVHDVTNATLGFDKVLVINLPERTDHRDRMILAAKVSGIEVNYVDGVHGDDIAKKTLPPNYNKDMGPSNIGAWRAHLNALKMVIEQDLSSALIMEDDVDWDIRLKPTLRDLALSSNALVSEDIGTVPLSEISPVSLSGASPYGDGWDLLWLGHCGMHMPGRGIVLHNDDPTVPEHRHLRSFIPNEITPLASYPQHTRATFRGTSEATCSLAYAVTQSAAQRILYDIGVDKLSESYDLMLKGWCAQPKSVCLSVLPQLFDHHRRAGAADVDSDISDPHQEPRTDPYTNNIRWSVQMNMKHLLRGDDRFDDQYPDA